jgi:DNA modification methylase
MAGDIVADFFAGSGTTAVVAERMGRKWIIGDSSEAAVELAKSRLGKVGCKFQVIHTEAQMQHFFSTSA